MCIKDGKYCILMKKYADNAPKLCERQVIVMAYVVMALYSYGPI